MRAEDLLSSAATPRGVDLVAAAKTAAVGKRRDTKVITRRHWKATVLLQPAANRARGSASNAFERAGWSVAELGQAAAGVPELQFCAACYAFAGERSMLWPLHRALSREAAKIARERRWPAHVRDIHGLDSPYLATLAKLVLDFDAMPAAFAEGEAAFALYMQTRVNVWAEQLADRFALLQGVWSDWLHVAMRIMQPRLRENQESDE